MGSMYFVWVIPAMLMASAFFSGIEIAFLSANKFKIELDKKKGVLASRIWSHFVQHPSWFICSILVGNNIALVIYGSAMAAWLEPVLGSALPLSLKTPMLIFTLQAFLSTLLILIAGEFIPKVIFRINPNQALSFFAFPVQFFYWLFYPIVFIVLSLANLVLKVFFNFRITENAQAFGRVDLTHFIKSIDALHSGSQHQETEFEMFRAALDFGKLRIRSCMIPRPELIAVELNDSVEMLRSRFIESGLSRILVYKESMDHIIGFVHLYEMFRNPSSIQSVLLPVSVFPESMPARELLRHFMQEHRSVAVVVDEHGITTGMVTVEDVMEEIFGEIKDEHDIEDAVEGRISEHEFIFSARLEVDYLNDRYGLNIPKGNYETLAGFILSRHEHLPAANEIISIPPFLFKIQSVFNNRIEQVRLKVTPQPGGGNRDSKLHFSG